MQTALDLLKAHNEIALVFLQGSLVFTKHNGKSCIFAKIKQLEL